jgi:glyoxylase-like metal-dependent hydrolase (beta-lactamase superfamily II)
MTSSNNDPNHTGPIKATPLLESLFGLDGGAMFGIIPRPLWEKTNPPDENNRIAMAARCLLLEWADGTRALVDVGMGERWSEKERGIYAIRDQDGGLREALSQRAIDPASIDHVVLTHLHFDHAGGLKRADGSAAFANATHWVQQRNWAWAHGPSARDGGSYRPEDFAFLAEDGAPKLELIDGIREILPGVEVLPQHGHTFGMQVVKVRLPHATLAFVADLIPTSSHLRDPYVMGYDLQPLVTVQEKRALLYEAARHDWVLCFEHDPTCDLARVELDARGRPRPVPVTLEQLHGA